MDLFRTLDNCHTPSVFYELMFPSVELTAARSQRSALAELVDQLDPDSIVLGEAEPLWEAFDGIVRLATSARTLVARRVEESASWKRGGDRSAAEHLARRAGTSAGAARSELETSKRLQALPGTESALRRGELSGPQAAAVADGATADPGAEQTLLHKARTSSLAELRDETARVKAAADPDPDATWCRLHAERRLRRFVDGEGAWNLTARGTVDAGSQFNAALDPIIDGLFTAARRQGRREPREAYAFDALVELALRTTAGAGGGSDDSDGGDGGDGRPSGEEEARMRTPGTGPCRRNPTHLALLRLDLEALLRGGVEGDERCEISGLGPVPVRIARRFLGDAVLKLVLTKGVDVANVTHLGRGPNAAQRIALLWSSPTCVVEGCIAVRTEADHRIPWSESRHTRLDELDALCRHHHALKTYDGWALVVGSGRRPLVAPDDPRHPANGPPAGADRAPPAGKGVSPTQTLFSC